MCHFEVSIESIEIAPFDRLQVLFRHRIRPTARNGEGGLLDIDEQWITVQPRGRLLVRAIAMVFDCYLRTDREQARYSKVIWSRASGA